MGTSAKMNRFEEIATALKATELSSARWKLKRIPSGSLYGGVAASPGDASRSTATQKFEVRPIHYSPICVHV